MRNIAMRGGKTFHDKLYGRKKMNYKYNCLNPIAACGLNNLTEKYERTEKFEEADAVFVRSAKMDELVPGNRLLAVARAGAGVNNIPHAEYAKKGIVGGKRVRQDCHSKLPQYRSEMTWRQNGRGRILNFCL